MASGIGMHLPLSHRDISLDEVIEIVEVGLVTIKLSKHV
jgi:hypothetical protein